MKFTLISIALTALVGFSQEMTPLDSLYANDSLRFMQRVILKPIQLWQHFSYEQQALNCQFEKSCSNYMVQAIVERGAFGGTIIGTDRIIRCNPAARHYHIQDPHARIQYDGRLIDPLSYVRQPHPRKNPILATTLSIVPGLGRTYAGHPYDGLFSFLLVSGFAYNTHNHYLAENNFMTGLNATFMTLFWLADFYGAYRTAQLAPPAGMAP